MRLEKSNIPSSARTKINQRFRNFETSVDQYKRKLRVLADDRAALFGGRYTDNPSGNSAADVQLEQRQQLLSGTDRLDRSTQRLRNSQALAYETEAVGSSTLAELHQQRDRISNTQTMLEQSEGYVDRSVKTLRGMARRYCTPLRPRLTPAIPHSQFLVRSSTHPFPGVRVLAFKEPGLLRHESVTNSAGLVGWLQIG